MKGKKVITRINLFRMSQACSLLSFFITAFHVRCKIKVKIRSALRTQLPRHKFSQKLRDKIKIVIKTHPGSGTGSTSLNGQVISNFVNGCYSLICRRKEVRGQIKRRVKQKTPTVGQPY